MVVNEANQDATYDTERALTPNLLSGTCHIHTEMWANTQKGEDGLLGQIIDAILPSRNGSGNH